MAMATADSAAETPMEKRVMKKILFFGVLAALILTLCMGAYAEEYVPGVTVAEDAASPTGYTVTFVYDDPEAEQIQLRPRCGAKFFAV